MSEISTGNGLNIVICCDYVPHHNWMAFASWYSISRNLPDARIMILCNRTNIKWNLFSWIGKCRISYDLHPAMEREEQIQLAMKCMDGPVIVLEPYTMAVRELTDDWMDYLKLDRIKGQGVSLVKKYAAEPTLLNICPEASEDRQTTFVSYREGWGKFVTSSWIDIPDSPFSGTSKYMRGCVLSVNERRIGELWKKMSPTYHMVSRG